MEPLVLYVDDLRGMITNVLTMLQDQDLYRPTLRSKFHIYGKNPEEAFEFLERHPEIALLICDHNLLGNRRPGGTYQFRYGYQFVQEMMRRGYRIPPIIIFSDDTSATSDWRKANVPYKCFIPKWGEGGKSPTDNLLEAVLRELNLV